jgi:integration host factor subunit beta
MSDKDPDNLYSVAKSGIVSRLAQKQTQLTEEDVEMAVNTILDNMIEGLVSGERVEIRGFGSLSLHFRPPRVGRNPKTGEQVKVPAKYVPHFKPGNELKKRVDYA